MDRERVRELIGHADELFRRGSWDQALALYHDVLTEDPDHAHAHNKIGAILAQRGQAEQAETCFRAAIAADPGLAQAHSNLGNLFFARGQYGEALEKYDEALGLQPHSAVFIENRAAALKKLGRLEEAIRALKDAQRKEREQARSSLRVRGKSASGCLVAVLTTLSLLCLGAWLVF